MTRPVLSILFTARNDNYHKDFVNRLEYVINYYIHTLNQLNIKNKVEINITDWGSLVPLHKVIKIYDNKFKNQVNFFFLKKKQADKLSYNIFNSFNHDLAVNIAARRSRGKFLMISPCDQFIFKYSLKNLIIFLEEEYKKSKNILYLLPRKFIPGNIWEKQPSIENLENFIEMSHFSKIKLESTRIHSGGGLGALIASKKILNTIDGPCYEGLGAFGARSRSDNDLLKRSSYFYSHMDLSSVGVSIMKLPYSIEGQRKFIVNRFYSKDINDYRFIPGNYKNWGLKDFLINKFNPGYNKNINSNNKKNKFFFIYKNSLLKKSLIRDCIRIGLHSLFNFESINEIFYNLLQTEIIKHTKVFNYIRIGDATTFGSSSISKIHSYLSMNIIYKNRLKSQFWDQLGSYMNYAHDGFYKCFGDDLSNSIKNVIKNNQYKNLESVLSIQDLGKQKEYKKIMKSAMNNNKFSFIFLRNFQEQCLKMKKSKFYIYFRYKNIIILANNNLSSLKENKYIVNRIYIIKKYISLLALIIYSLFFLKKTYHWIYMLRRKIRKLIK